MPAPIPADFFDGSLPIALVVDDANFIGPHLHRELTKLGVKVLLQNDVDLDEIPRTDYIFCVVTGDGFSPQEIKRLLDFTEEKNARFLFATDGVLPQIETQIEKKSDDVRFIRLLDVFGPGMGGKGIVGQILRLAAGNKPLEISGDQEDPVYPVWVGDVVLILIKAQMAPGTKGLRATLAGHKMTAYSFAQEVKRAHSASSGQASKKDLEITFREGTTARDLDETAVLAGQRQLSWHPEELNDEGLAETLAFLSANKNVALEPKPEVPKTAGFWESKDQKDKKGDVPRRFKKRVLVLPLFVLGVLFWLFALPAVQLGIGLAEFSYGQFERSKFWFDLAGQSFLSWENLPGLKNEAGNLSSQSKLMLRAANIGGQEVILAKKIQDLKTKVVSRESYSLATSIQDLQVETNTLERELGFLEAELKNKPEVKISFFPDFSATLGEVVKAREQVSFFGSLLTVLPELLGQEAAKTYLVLLQNNTELRGSGGTVKAVGFLTFEKGRLINLEVKEVEPVDSRQKGQIEAPAPLVDYLGLTSWNLENSGWSADFATAASRAAWFVNTELEQKVDGVIGLDLEFIKALLETTGKLQLENGEVVDATNVYQKVQRGEKSFFALTLRAVLESLKKPEQAAIETRILSLAKEKHLSFWFTMPKVQTVFGQTGIDGGVRSVTCQTAVQFENCLTDYLQVVDANLGKNQISQLVEKTHSLEIDIKNKVLAHKMTVTLDNKAVTGPYKSYLRLYVPATANLSLAAEVNPQTGEQTTHSAELSSDRGKRTFGLFVEIPPGEVRQLVFLWEVSFVRTCPECNEGELVFLWQKQQGAASSPYVVRINLPVTDLKVGAYPVPSLTEEGTIGYNNHLSGDLPVNIIWQSK